MFKSVFIFLMIIAVSANLAHANAQQYVPYMAEYDASGTLTNIKGGNEVLPNDIECMDRLTDRIQLLRGIASIANKQLIQYSDFTYGIDVEGYVMYGCIPIGYDAIDFFPPTWTDETAHYWAPIMAD